MMSINKKIFFIFIFFIFSIIYSLQNIYGESPSVIIKSEKQIDEKFLNKLKNVCYKNNIIIKSILIDNNLLVLKFNSTNDQFFIYEFLKNLNMPINLSLNILNNNIKFFEIIKAYPMKLGLDLRGGVHFSLKVYTQYLLDKFFFVNLNLIKDEIKKKDISAKLVLNLKDMFIDIYFFEVRSCVIFEEFFNNYFIDFDIVKNDKSNIRLYLKATKELELKRSCIEKTIYILNNRINELGISDSVIYQRGLENIVIELPGIQDIIYAKKILGNTATLKFMFMNNDIKKYNKDITNDMKIFYTLDNKPILVDNNIILDGTSIVNSSFDFDPLFNKPCVNIKINKESAKKFSNITKKNIGNFMVIVYREHIFSSFEERIDEHVISVAKVMSSLGESFQITGLGVQEAKDLSLLLRTGVLPTAISIVEEKLIGPELGENNIINSLKFLFFSFLFILFFMIIRYKKFGLLCMFSLLVNFLLLIAFMSIFQVTLTFPGLAGLALTLGISIDANILIFERIREELKILSFDEAVYIGFKNAFRSILDSNVTTLLVAVILFTFAVGPIRGFALILSIGIFTSFYSSVFVTKTLIDFFLLSKYK